MNLIGICARHPQISIGQFESIKIISLLESIDDVLSYEGSPEEGILEIDMRLKEEALVDYAIIEHLRNMWKPNNIFINTYYDNEENKNRTIIRLWFGKAEGVN